MFLHVRHLAKGAGVAAGQEHGIVAETPLAARRPDERAGDLALEFLDVSVGPGEAKRADEMRLALTALPRAALAQLVFHRLHGAPEVLFGTRPARRINAGIAVECINRQPGIVGEGRQACRGCRRARLDAGVLLEARAALPRLGHADLPRPPPFDTL